MEKIEIVVDGRMRERWREREKAKEGDRDR